MARAEQPRSLRFSRFESKRLIFALVLSLLVHLGAWGGYELGKKSGWWERLNTFMRRHQMVKVNPPPAVKVAEPEAPTVFVEVSQPDPEPPKKTIYYSDKNSHAANPDADQNSNQPKLNGKQRNVPKTEDVPKASKLQPSAPLTPAPETKPKEASPQSSSQNLGDQKLAKPDKTESPDGVKTPPTPDRPRTLNEARAQHRIPGPQMQQDGGVHRKRLVASFDAKATAFGAYDGAMIAAVTQKWYDELDNYQFAQDRRGKVVIQFNLRNDGTVNHVEILENSVGDLLGAFCQIAIEKPAPFGPWPPDMLRMIGSTERPITFTFFY